MTKLPILNQKGEKVKDLTLNQDVWAIEPNDAVLHNAIVLAKASLRQGTHKSKTRSEVRGGGRKPWRQKGTGRARAGSIRSGIWRGGGTIFGPNPRSYSKAMNRKERRLAMRSALSYVTKNKTLVGIDSLAFKEYKTKEMLKLMDNIKVNGKVLFVTDELNEEAYYASRNLPKVRMITADSLGVLDVVNADYMVVTPEAVNVIEEVLTNAK